MATPNLMPSGPLPPLGSLPKATPTAQAQPAGKTLSDKNLTRSEFNQLYSGLPQGDRTQDADTAWNAYLGLSGRSGERNTTPVIPKIEVPREKLSPDDITRGLARTSQDANNLVSRSQSTKQAVPYDVWEKIDPRNHGSLGYREYLKGLGYSQADIDRMAPVDQTGSITVVPTSYDPDLKTSSSAPAGRPAGPKTSTPAAPSKEDLAKALEFNLGEGAAGLFGVLESALAGYRGQSTQDTFFAKNLAQKAAERAREEAKNLTVSEAEKDRAARLKEIEKQGGYQIAAARGREDQNKKLMVASELIKRSENPATPLSEAQKVWVAQIMNGGDPPLTPEVLGPKTVSAWGGGGMDPLGVKQ